MRCAACNRPLSSWSLIGGRAYGPTCARALQPKVARRAARNEIQAARAKAGAVRTGSATAEPGQMELTWLFE